MTIEGIVMRTRRVLLAAGLLASLSPAPASAQPTPASAQPVIDHAWARATTDLAQTAAAYLTITSPIADQLVTASSPAARSVEVHLSREENGIMEMRPVPMLPIPPGTPVRLAPGGYHAMLTGLAKPLHVGDHFPLTLTFQHAGAVTTEVTVEPAGATAAAAGMTMDHSQH